MSLSKAPAIFRPYYQKPNTWLPKKAIQPLSVCKLAAYEGCIKLQSLSSVVTLHRFGNEHKQEREALEWLKQRRRNLETRLSEARTLLEWLDIATELDQLDGNDEWKAITESKDYEWMIVQNRLEELKRVRYTGNVNTILHYLRTSMDRNLGGITNPSLYRKCRVRTKDLIDEFITMSADTVSMVLDLADKLPLDMEESRHILEQLSHTQQTFGRTALLLSGGSTFGMNHIGVVTALWGTHLLPRVISGSSAGGVVGAVLCASTDAEIPLILDTLGKGDLCIFESNGRIENALVRIRRLLATGALFDSAHLTSLLRELLGDITFQEAYDRTGRILNIGVSVPYHHELLCLLNYLTAPEVVLWSAVAASCSIPLVFAAAPILSKNPVTRELTEWNETNLRWVDGSLANDVPMLKLSQMFHVNHFIVSQVNPHVIPFVPAGEILLFGERKERDPDYEAGWFSSLGEFAKQEMMGQMAILSEAGLLPNTLKKAGGIVEQSYYGDINILPKLTQGIFPSVYRNPTAEFMTQSRLSGERATWPKLGRIRNHCAIELALEVAVRTMKERVSTLIPNLDRIMDTHSASLSLQMREERRQGTERLRSRSPDNRLPNSKNVKGYTANFHARRLRKSRSMRSQAHRSPPSLLVKPSQLPKKHKIARSNLKNVKLWRRRAGNRRSHNGTDTKTLLASDRVDEGDVSTRGNSSSYTSYSDVSYTGSQSPAIRSRRPSFSYDSSASADIQPGVRPSTPEVCQEASSAALTLPSLVSTAISRPPSPEQLYIQSPKDPEES